MAHRRGSQNGFSLRYNEQTRQWDVVENHASGIGVDNNAWVYEDEVVMKIIDRALDYMQEFPTVEAILSRVVDSPDL